MRHSGLPGKRRSVFGESIFTPRARALFLTPAATSDDANQAVKAGEKTSFFLGGIDKGIILETLRPHIFFDDQIRHLESASRVVPSVHIPYGITNAETSNEEVSTPSVGGGD